MRLPVLILPLLAAAAPLVTAPAAAQTRAEDARCLAISMLATRNGDVKVRQTASLAVAYWLGRLDARGTPAQVEAELIRQAPAIKPANLQAEAKRCSPVHARRLNDLQATSRRMSAARAETKPN